VLCRSFWHFSGLSPILRFPRIDHVAVLELRLSRHLNTHRERDSTMRTTMIGWAALLAWSASLTAAEPAASPPARWNVAEAGAVGDGKADATAAFQQALDAAGKAGGGVVDVPAGRYAIRGNLAIPAGVTLEGTYRVPPTIERGAGGELAGSVLMAYAGRGKTDDKPFIRLAGNNAALMGLVITYPEWKQTDVPPVPYPPCVLAEGVENVAVQECLLLNPYEGIKLVRAARHLVRNVTGYPIKRGLYVDECYDIGHIENVHYWPFGVSYNPKDPYCLWINTQGVAFELARTDWHYVFNTFCFGYGVGYKFSESKAGSTNGNFLGLGADSCQRAVLVEQAQPPGLLITNGEFVGRWSSQDAVCLEVGPKVAGKVSLVNCSFWGPIDRCVWVRSPAGQFAASTCHFVHWDVRGTGSPALQFDEGRVSVQGCTFAQEGTGVLVGEKVTSAILIGNQASGGFLVENRAGGRTQMLANEASPVEWTAEARRHYRVDVGEEGDGRYTRGFYGRERMPGPAQDKTMRWSMAESRLSLPVVAGTAYTLTIEASMPDAAGSPEAGIYVDGKRLAEIKPGAAATTVKLPPTEAELAAVELRCRGWVPREVQRGSNDDRTLGLALYSLTMKADGAAERVFEANTGQWQGP
jgi:hypothetical protein